MEQTEEFKISTINIREFQEMIAYIKITTRDIGHKIFVTKD